MAKGRKPGHKRTAADIEADAKRTGRPVGTGAYPALVATRVSDRDAATLQNFAKTRGATIGAVTRAAIKAGIASRRVKDFLD